MLDMEHVIIVGGQNIKISVLECFLVELWELKTPYAVCHRFVSANSHFTPFHDRPYPGLEAANHVLLHGYTVTTSPIPPLQGCRVHKATENNV